MEIPKNDRQLSRQWTIGYAGPILVIIIFFMSGGKEKKIAVTIGGVHKCEHLCIVIKGLGEECRIQHLGQQTELFLWNPHKCLVVQHMNMLF